MMREEYILIERKIYKYIGRKISERKRWEKGGRENKRQEERERERQGQ